MQNTFVDFRRVKTAVSLSMALEHYGINWLRKKGDELRGRCPIHKGEGTDTFHANLVKNAFHCFSCKARGNVLDFVAAMEQCTVRDAAVKLAEWFSVVSDGPSQQSPARKADVPKEQPTKSRGEGSAKNQPLKFQLKGVDSNHAYIASRGISRETVETFGVGFFTGKGSMSGRLVIPIHNERGELIAYAGRSIDGSEPKYKLPAGFHKGLELFNLHRVLAKTPAGAGSTVVLVEGFFDCMKVHEAGYAAVALMGSSLSTEQERLLCSHFTGVILMLDGDEAGGTGIDDCLLRLGRKLWVRAIALPENAQPDSLSGGELHQLLFS
jgi:DNA primase